MKLGTLSLALVSIVHFACSGIGPETGGGESSVGGTLPITTGGSSSNATGGSANTTGGAASGGAVNTGGTTATGGDTSVTGGSSGSSGGSGTAGTGGKSSHALLLDDAHSVTQLILAAKGGQIPVSGPDGHGMTLDVPPNALSADTAITMVPILQLAEGQLLVGASLEPSGLAFQKAATLTIDYPGAATMPALHGFSYSGNGTGYHFYPATYSGQSFAIPVAHFSGYGIDSGNITPPAPTDLVAGYEQRLAYIGIPGTADEESDIAQLITDVLTEWYTTIVKPAILAANEDTTCSVAVRLYAEWDAAVQQESQLDAAIFTGTRANENEAVSLILDAFVRGTDTVWKRNCKASHPPPLLNADSLYFLQWLQQLGISDDGRVAAAAAEKTECVKVLVNITNALPAVISPSGPVAVSITGALQVADEIWTDQPVIVETALGWDGSSFWDAPPELVTDTLTSSGNGQFTDTVFLHNMADTISLKITATYLGALTATRTASFAVICQTDADCNTVAGSNEWTCADSTCVTPLIL